MEQKELESGKYYRLKWIGSTEISNDNMDRLVNVCYQEIENYDEYFEALKKSEAFQKRIFLKGEDVLAKVNIRRLPGLKIGTIYKAEVAEKNHDSYGPRLEFSINVSNGFEIPLFDLVGKNYLFDLPFDPVLNSKAWVFTRVKGVYPKMKTDNDVELDIIIIPTYEIIRFYYCDTSNMANAIFDGGTETREIAYVYRWNQEEGDEKLKPFIILGKKMADFCANTIGRIFFEPTALKNVRRIYDCQIESDIMFPSSGFPFSDTTKLVVNCEKLKIKNGSPLFKRYPELNKEKTKIYLTSEILSCDHLFPFDEIEFLRENDGRSLLKNLGIVLKELTPRIRYFGGSRKQKEQKEEGTGQKANEEDNKDKENSSRDNSSPEIEIVNSPIKKFPSGRPIATKLEKENQKTFRKIKLVFNRKKKTNTRGRGLDPDGLQGVDTYQLDEQTELELMQVIEALKKSGYKETFFNLNKGGGDFSYFPAEDLKRRPGYTWCFLSYRIKRKCWVCKLQNQNQIFYIIEVQRRLDYEKLKQEDRNNKYAEAFMFFVIQMNSIDEKKEEDLLKKFLLSLAINHGCSSSDKVEDLIVKKLKHIKESPEKRVNKILALLGK